MCFRLGSRYDGVVDFICSASIDARLRSYINARCFPEVSGNHRKTENLVIPTTYTPDLNATMHLHNAKHQLYAIREGYQS